MARKKAKNSASNGILIIFALAFGAVASIPKDAWIGIGAIACIITVFWLLVRRAKRQREQISATTLESTRQREHQGIGLTISVRGVSTSHMDADEGSDFYTVQLGSPSSKSFKIPDAGSQKSDARWVPAGESVTVSGFSLPGGMFYVGSAGGRNDPQEPSLINPKLRIAKTHVDIEERLMSYWPSFHSITPEARRG